MGGCAYSSLLTPYSLLLWFAKQRSGPERSRAELQRRKERKSVKETGQ